MKTPRLNKTTKGKIKHTAVITLLVLLAVWDHSNMKVTTGKNGTDSPGEAATDTPKPALFQYKTIAIPDSTNQLLGYEFHAWKGDYGVDYSCFAIIKKIDPAKDNYKLYSRAIVADIISAIGTSDIDVTIYDDYQAYTLAELNGGQEFKMLTKIEEDSINDHTVANYHARSGGWCDNTHMLSFYTQAGNNYTENEPY
jgi:hypothetical protein